MTFRTSALALGLAAASALLAGCAAYDFPARALEFRQQVSAGYTGCDQADNTITDVTNHGWHATCKGRTYVCSGADRYACAPAAQ